MPPHMVEAGAEISSSMVTEGCTVGGKVEKSVLFAGVEVESGAEVIESIIMPGAVIESGAKFIRSIVGENAVVEAGAKVGEPGGKIALIGPGAVVEANTVQPAGAIFGKEAK